MRSKKFEYFHKDIKQLKIDIIFRFIFSFSFLAVFIWQIISMILVASKNDLSLIESIVASLVLVSSFMLCFVTFSYAFKDLRIISAIKMNGKCVSSVNILFSVQKTGFLKLYSFLMQFLTLATSLVLIASITYSILEIAVLSTISFYMPLIVLICMAGYNSIYHIKDEINTQKTVHEQNSSY